MSVKAIGIRAFNKKLMKVPKALQQHVKKTLGDAGNKITREARANHDYTRRSGNLDRAIQSKVVKDEFGTGVGLQVWINPQFVTSGSYNYGVIQHDGKGGGYSRSPISPSFRVTGNSGSQKRDWFLYNAYSKNLPALKKDMNNASLFVHKKLGLK